MKTPLLALLLLSSCTITVNRNEHHGSPRWVALSTGTAAGLRGVSAVSADVLWVSGSSGTVLRSLDGGRSWQNRDFSDQDSDLRDIEAVDADTAYAITITTPARIVRTIDGGRTWSVLHESGDQRSFYDSLALLREPSAARSPVGALAFGDPLDGSFEVLRCPDGQHWEQVGAANLPPALAGEAAFAASGTCIVAHSDRHAWIGTGGQHARVLRSTDGGRSWLAAPTPLRQGAPTSGIYSIAFRDEQVGVIVGGDYTQPELAGENAALTTDGGVTWKLAQRGPSGYRSAVAYVPGHDQLLVAVGRAGCDWSSDGGRTWEPFGPQGEGAGYYALSFAPDGTGYAVGADGRVARLAWER